MAPTTRAAMNPVSTALAPHASPLLAFVAPTVGGAVTAVPEVALVKKHNLDDSRP